MATTIWEGTVTAPFTGGSALTFTLDPATGGIAQVSSSGPIQFQPNGGYAQLSGGFSSTITFRIGALPADPTTAWEAAAPNLVILDATKTYTMTITQAD